jgi:putative membrane-bound dehydrogenase-like protein
MIFPEKQSLKPEADPPSAFDHQYVPAKERFTRGISFTGASGFDKRTASRVARRGIVLAGLICVWSVAAVRADENAPGNETRSPQSTTGGTRDPAFVAPPMQVPDGFQVQLVAAPPLVRYPMAACFDERGRLFVADNVGANYNAAQLEELRPNRILLLEDTDQDGRFDTSTVFADQLTYPAGVEWYRGALYVASAPYLWRMRDTDEDGVADERQQLVGRFNYIGIGNDLHGPLLAPDGRLYWTHGRGGGGHELMDANGNLIDKNRTAAIFSCWPDGTDIRKHCDGGMDNPVELAFMPEGQMIGSVNLLEMPVRDDALVHWMWGGVYPRRDVIGSISGLQRTGGLLGSTVSFGHVALSGVTRYRSRQFGDQFQDNLFVAVYNAHKVQRVVLERHGATYRGRIHDFLSSNRDEVRFADTWEDADGSLMVIDTGDWFREKCPAAQLSEVKIYGAIYRVRRIGAAVPRDPWGREIEWDQLAGEQLVPLLDDDRFAVRQRALDTLSQRGDEATAILRRLLVNSPSAAIRQRAVWALCRMRSKAAQAAVRTALADRDSGVRESAAHAVFAAGDELASPPLIALLTDDAVPVRREAATALGVLGDPQAVPALLDATAAGTDRLLEHAIVYALIEIDDRQSTLVGLHHPAPDVRRAALVALDQMEHGNLTRDLVTRLLDTDDPQLQSTALEVISRHEGWANEITDLLRRWLAEDQLPADRQASLRGALLAFHRDADVQQLIGETLARSGTPIETRLLLLEIVGRCEPDSLPESWRRHLATSLKSEDPRVVRRAINAIAASGERQFDRVLAELAVDGGRATALRVVAAAVVSGGGQPLRHELFELLASQCHPDVEAVERLAAARALGSARLDGQQLADVTELIARAGPLELPSLVRVYEEKTSAEDGRRLFGALKKSPGLTSLPAVRLRRLLENYPAEVAAAAEPLLKQLSTDTRDQLARIDQLAGALEGGDPLRGHEVFHGSRAACVACHRVGAEGGTVGPDLSRIGAVRKGRGLLESIVFPSATFARGYESFNVVTDSGRVHSGVISRETTDAVYLRTAERAETRVPRADIDQLVPSNVSIMPQGLDKELSPEQLRDLVAYLSSLKG